jgi:hypothetical protein
LGIAWVIAAIIARNYFFADRFGYLYFFIVLIVKAGIDRADRLAFRESFDRALGHPDKPTGTGTESLKDY